MDLCKTRTKKSSPDMFNFYVVCAGHDKVSDAGIATTCRRKFKATSLQTKSTKKEESFENMSFEGKTLWRFCYVKTWVVKTSVFEAQPFETDGNN